MRNRTSANPGRVLITPEDGSAAFYAILTRADNPTEKGDPLSKETLLKDATAALYGLDATAVPDEVLERISRMFPANMGVLTVYIASAGGSPIDTMIRITPAINEETDFVTLPNGRFSIFAPPGTYTVSIVNSPFIITSDSAKSVTVTAGCFAKTSFTAKWVDSGKAYIEESRTLYVPEHLSSVDLCAIGGGGSGATETNNNGVATGGAGGYLKNMFSANLGGKTLSITVGAGGERSQSDTGKAGGSTTVKSNGSAILNAPGGGGGKRASSRNAAGADGGSGSGGVYNNVCYDGGSDGSDGGGNNGGKGQGTTTREFGEASGTLYCGGGGSMNYGNGTDSAGGAGGGGDGVYGGNTSATVYGGDGTAYGAGGGAAGAYNYKYSGAGYQGVLIIRW